MKLSFIIHRWLYHKAHRSKFTSKATISHFHIKRALWQSSLPRGNISRKFPFQIAISSFHIKRVLWRETLRLIPRAYSRITNLHSAHRAADKSCLFYFSALVACKLRRISEYSRRRRSEGRGAREKHRRIGGGLAQKKRGEHTAEIETREKVTTGGAICAGGGDYSKKPNRAPSWNGKSSGDVVTARRRRLPIPTHYYWRARASRYPELEREGRRGSPRKGENLCGRSIENTLSEVLARAPGRRRERDRLVKWRPRGSSPSYLRGLRLRVMSFVYK